MKLYEDLTYQAFMKDLAKDPAVCGVLADWLEESVWSTSHEEYIKHLRAGNPVPKELNDYDWKEAFGGAGEPETENSYNLSSAPPDRRVPAFAFTRREVQFIIAMQDGENDGPDWVAVGELWDGRFFAVRGGCDYTGWG